MALTFNLRHLERKPLRLEGDLPPSDLDAEGIDEMITLRHPIHYDLRLERLAENVLVQGSLSTALDCECVRCLKQFSHELKMNPWTVSLALSGEEKVPVNNDCVDLTPLIREDILLAFPQHPLCERDCRGLPPAAQPMGKRGGAQRKDDTTSPWAELDKLKL